MNIVTLTGNLTHDPEVKYTPGGTAVCEVSIAINDRKKIRDEWQDVTTYVDVTLWGRTAENAGKYLTKGRKIAVVGKLTQDSWKDKETGKQRTELKVTADTVEFLGNRGPEDQRPPTDNYGEEPQVPVTAGSEDVPF